MSEHDTVEVIRGTGWFLQEVPRGSFQATTVPRMPRPKGPTNPRELWVNMGAGGLGDSLLGLCAIKGLKAEKPDRDIIYGVNYKYWRIVALFDGGYDGLAIHVWDDVVNDIPPMSNASDLQMNMGYQLELTGGCEIDRLDRYCRNIGGVFPQLPALRRPEDVEVAGKPYKDAIVLAPFSAQKDRDYPLHGWLTIEKELTALGYRVIVVGARHEHKVNRTDLFKCEVMLDVAPTTLVGILKSAAVVIANDSGPAHLAGIMGTPTLVLCGWSIGAKIFGFYPRVTCLQGMFDCNGCWTKAATFDRERCGVICANIASIEPQRVIREVITRASVCLSN